MTDPTITAGEVLDAVRSPLTELQRRRVRRMLDAVCDFSRPCKVCSRQIWFLRTKRSSLMPVTDDATVHWADCPGADDLRGTRAHGRR